MCFLTKVLAVLVNVTIAPIRLHHKFRGLALIVVLVCATVLVHGVEQLKHSSVHRGAKRVSSYTTITRHGPGDAIDAQGC